MFYFLLRGVSVSSRDHMSRQRAPAARETPAVGARNDLRVNFKAHFLSNDLDSRTENHLDRRMQQPPDRRDRFAAIGFMAIVFVPLLMVHLVANVFVWVGVSHP